MPMLLAQHLKHCVLENQRFYAGVTLFQHHMAPFGAGAPKETVPSRDGCLQSSEDHMSKLRSTLHQCVRDWAAEVCFGGRGVPVSFVCILI